MREELYIYAIRQSASCHNRCNGSSFCSFVKFTSNCYVVLTEKDSSYCVDIMNSKYFSYFIDCDINKYL
ncbi:hypothetical protein HNR55_003416 [Acetobacter lovaniensis]|uniref:Uncharacterized protein n=1 Tax=Acetobacter lovaniensis TaxID=104100 RepID=A0A841QLK7_9PROT|nr:hypothetical protein [Acetobacter lovaniensis]